MLPNKQRHANWQKGINISFLLPIFVLFVSVITIFSAPVKTEAVTSDTLNFQGRLLTSGGALVPDGNYNVEFNLYSVASGGSTLWTESRTGGNTVTVRNGYFSVYLGDVTTFPNSIPWDQELWLGMNVEADGEMTPRFKLTAVPYAFRAGAVLDGSGNALTGDDIVQLGTGSLQALNSAQAAIRYNQSGAGGLLQLQGDGVDVFTVDKTGATVIGQGLTLGSSTSTTAGTIRWSGSDFEGYNGSGWVSLTSGGGGGGGISSAIVSFGKVEGATGNALNISGASSSRTSTGEYTITLSSALPTANYTILLTAEEPGIDDINAQVTSQSTTGFTVSLNLGDNGVGANVPTDRTFHFVVIDDSAGGGDYFAQGGNAFGTTAILGTTDAESLQLVTNDTAALTIDNAQNATFSSAVDIDGLLSANNGIDITSGNLDLSNGNITGVNSLSALTISGDGSSITNLDGSNIASGTIADARLSTNVALKDTANTFSDVQTFTGGAVLGNFTSAVAGAIRWTGADFEGFDGVQWISLSDSGADVISISKSANETVTNSAALQDDDELFFDVGANETWTFDFVLQANSGTTPDFRFAVTAPTGSTCQIAFSDEENAVSNGQYGCGVTSQSVAGTAAPDAYRVFGSVRTGPTAGQVRLQWAQFVANGAATTVYAGSYVHAVSENAVIGGGGGGGGVSFEQNGNTFGATGILGTTDSFGLRIVSGNVNSLEFTATGESTFSQAADFSSTLSVDGLLSANNGIDIASGNLDLSNGNITGVNSITATNLVGNGSGLTDLSGDAISSGTIADARLSTNVALLTGSQTFTGLPTFSNGLVVGNSASTTAGAIRWTGTDFEGFDGIQWVSLTQGSASGAPLLQGVLAFGKINGATGSALSIDGASTVRNGTGDYTVTLDTPATTSNYVVQLTVEETGANLDDINISLDNQTTLGFDVDIREGDNSGTADVPIDKNWHFIVFDADAVAGGGGGGGGTAFEQGGNAFGGTAVLGTTDTNGISIIADNSLALSISSAGNATFVNDVQFNGKINLGTLPTVDLDAQASFFSGSATGKGIVVQGAASQTENLFEVQDSSGSVLAAFTSSGGLILGNTTLQSVATTSQTAILPDASGTICISTNNCNYLELASGSFATDASTNNSIAINKTGPSGNILALQNNGAAVFTVANTGSLEIQATDSAALDIMNVGGSSFFSVDTSSGIVRVGPSAADANGVLFVLDTKNTAGDPAGENGGIYYNSSLGKFRCYEDGSWKDCIGTRQVRSFIDTTTDAVVDNNTTDYWDTAAENNNSYPNITPSSTVKAITASVVIEVLESGSTADRVVQSRIERGIGAPPTCGSGTVVGPVLSNFTTNNNQNDTTTVIFVDEPSTTSTVFYTVCSDTATSSAANMSVTRLRFTLEEANNSN